MTEQQAPPVHVHVLTSVSPKGYGKPRPTTELTDEQFDAFLKVDELATQIAEVAEPLWWLGTGFGAEVINRVRHVCHEAGRRYYPEPVPDVVRRAVYARDGFKCLVCGARRDLSIDHMTPSSMGGANDMENLQTLCLSCNKSKNRRTQSEWEAWLEGEGSWRVGMNEDARQHRGP